MIAQVAYVAEPCPILFLFRLYGFIVTLALLVAATARAPALGTSPYDNPATAEGWAWARIKEGRAADFNERCGTTQLDARASDENAERGWRDDRRRLPPSFFVDVLTKAQLRDQVPFAGVHVVGARIVGDFDLGNAKIDQAIFIERSRIKGDIKIEATRTNSDVRLMGSRVAGSFFATQLHGELSLVLRIRARGEVGSCKDRWQR